MSDKLPTKPVLLGNSLKNDLLGSIMACQNSLLMFAFKKGGSRSVYLYLIAHILS